jgi:hypothetical protein
LRPAPKERIRPTTGPPPDRFFGIASPYGDWALGLGSVSTRSSRRWRSGASGAATPYPAPWTARGLQSTPFRLPGSKRRKIPLKNTPPVDCKTLFSPCRAAVARTFVTFSTSSVGVCRCLFGEFASAIPSSGVRFQKNLSGWYRLRELRFQKACGRFRAWWGGGAPLVQTFVRPLYPKTVICST